VLRSFRLALPVAGQPFYVTNEAELKTQVFTVGVMGSGLHGLLPEQSQGFWGCLTYFGGE
jgi:hypothetical protein